MWEVGAKAETRDVICYFLLGAGLTVEGKHHLVAQSQIYHPDGLNLTMTIIVLNAIIRKVA